MARLFTRASSEKMDFAVGALDLSGAQLTVAWVWRVATTHAGGLIYMSTNVGNSAKRWSINPFSDGNYWFGNDVSAQAERAYEVGVWCLDAVTNDAAGSANRAHHYSYPAATWTHTAKAALAGAGGTVDHVHVGQFDNSGTEYLDADLAVMGVWDRALPDAELELLPFTLATWHATRPKALWVFDQAAVADKVLDLTGGGANESARTGTSVSTDSVPVFNRHGFVFPVTHGLGGLIVNINPELLAIPGSIN